MSHSSPWGADLAGLAFRKACSLLESQAKSRGWYETTPEEKAEIRAARKDFWAFFRYCARDKFGDRLDVQDFQRELYDFHREHPRTVTELPNECGKSELHIWEEIWMLAHAPETHAMVIASLIYGMALKQTDGIQKAIEENVRLHRVFPHLRKGPLWQRGCFSVAGNKSRIPSVQATGRNLKVNGDRLTYARLDDMVDSETCRSTYQQEKLTDGIESVIMGRMLAPPPNDPKPGGFPSAGIVRFVGHPWRNGDVLQRMKAKETFKTFSRPVIQTYTADPVAEIRALTEAEALPRLLWPAKWPLSRILEEIPARGATNFCRTLLMIVRDPTGQMFRDAWLLRAIRAGEGLDMRQHRLTPGERAAVGYDLAAGERAGADNNAAAALLWQLVRRYVLMSIEDDDAQRWTPEEWTERIIDHARRYPRAEHQAEDNLGLGTWSDWAMRSVREAKQRDPSVELVQIRSAYAGAKKWDAQVGVAGVALMLERDQFAFALDSYPPGERIAVELLDDHGERQIVHLAPALARLVAGMQDYSEGDRHLPDGLAALWVAFMALGGVQDARSAPKPRPSTRAPGLTDFTKVRY